MTSAITTKWHDAVHPFLIALFSLLTAAPALAYTPLDDVALSSDAMWVQTTYVHNGFGEVIQEVSPDRGTSSYTYNAGGELMSMTDGRGQVMNYTRDILGRTLTVTPVGRPVSEIITYSYDAGNYGEGITVTGAITPKF